jgi:hypothetical protein
MMIKCTINYELISLLKFCFVLITQWFCDTVTHLKMRVLKFMVFVHKKDIFMCYKI